MLKIINPEDVIEVTTLNMCIYGGPGIGKTSLAQTAEDPITLDFDNGIERAAFKKHCNRVSSWQDVASINADDVKKFKTIVVDTAGRLVDVMTADIIQKNPKLGRGPMNLTLQGFGELKSRFIGWMKLLNSFGKDVVLLAHLEEQRSGDDVIERLEIPGSSKGEIYKSAQAMARVLVDVRLQRSLDFSPRPNAFGKDPARLGVVPFPDPLVEPDTLAKLIQTIKQYLNKLSQEQQDQQQIIEEWVEALKAMTRPDELNKLLPQITAKNTKLPAAVRSHLWKRSKELNFVYDLTNKLFVAPQEASTHAVSQ